MANAPGYRVQVYSKADMSDSVYKRFTEVSGAMSGLTPKTAYFARVRVIGAAGENLTAYSPAVTFTTPSASITTPTGFTGTTTYRTVNLAWNPVPNARDLGRQSPPRRNVGADGTAITDISNTAKSGDSARLPLLLPGTVIDEAGTSLSAYAPGAEPGPRRSRRPRRP